MNILIHASAFKKVVIAPNIFPYSNRIINGTNGFLYELGNLFSLSLLLKKISIMSVENKQRIQDYAQKWALKYSSLHTVASFSSILNTKLYFSPETFNPGTISETFYNITSIWDIDSIIENSIPFHSVVYPFTHNVSNINDSNSNNNSYSDSNNVILILSSLLSSSSPSLSLGSELMPVASANPAIVSSKSTMGLSSSSTTSSEVLNKKTNDEPFHDSVPVAALADKSEKGNPFDLMNSWIEDEDHTFGKNITMNNINSIANGDNNYDYGINSSTFSSDDNFYYYHVNDSYDEVANDQSLDFDYINEGDDRTEYEWPSYEEIKKEVKRLEKKTPSVMEEGELMRIGQSICIYQIYESSAQWPFIYDRNNLYRGVCISDSVRPNNDDIKANERIPLLQYSYYIDVLCDYGALFSIAFEIDEIHKHPWIGFQHWSHSFSKLELSSAAEKRLVQFTEENQSEKVFVFWAASRNEPGATFTLQRFNKDSNRLLSRKVKYGLHNSSVEDNNAGHMGVANFDSSSSELNSEDFWATCDSLNAGNCQESFLRVWKKMYGLGEEWKGLPSMTAVNGDTWCSSLAWALPTPSFVQFVMFLRLLVNALDNIYYHQHFHDGYCPFGNTPYQKQHCYCKFLDKMINVWAYHSGHRFFFLDPISGNLSEQHLVTDKKSGGAKWHKWVSKGTLKSLDEDLAEEFDDERPDTHWVWPLTGEIVWSKSLEWENNLKRLKAMEKARLLELKHAQMRADRKQKPLGGRYKSPKSKKIKPPIINSGIEKNFDSDNALHDNTQLDVTEHGIADDADATMLLSGLYAKSDSWAGKGSDSVSTSDIHHSSSSSSSASSSLSSLLLSSSSLSTVSSQIASSGANVASGSVITTNLNSTAYHFRGEY